MVPTPVQSTIFIRDIESIAEMRAVEDLQKEVWGCSERDIVPALTLIPAKEVGGVLLGAFDGETLVGFAFGFIGLEKEGVVLHSDMLAVKPGYRNLDLGYKLKLVQREKALALGLSRMTWTFDPLQSRNAHLNFGKLGVVADSYKINFYGEETSSVLHQHTGTDRLWVTWQLDSERVQRRLKREPSSKPIIPELESVDRLVCLRADGSPYINQLRKNANQEQVLVEIPSDINTLQQENLALAVQWREATRQAFCEALDAGYIVEEFYRDVRSEQRCGAYLLSRAKKSKTSSYDMTSTVTT